jgi:sigma-E factor negative regulatory protein RseA
MTEKLSSLMDGELAAEEAQSAIKDCCASEKAKIDWHLYHVIGDAMRGHAPKTLAMPAEVIEALKAQPTVLAPRRAPATFTRIALAAAASVATIGVVGWIGTQGGQGASPLPPVAKSSSGIQPASNTVVITPQQAAPAIDVQTYLDAHRQLPTRELYRPVNNRTPAAAGR